MHRHHHQVKRRHAEGAKVINVEEKRTTTYRGRVVDVYRARPEKDECGNWNDRRTSVMRRPDFGRASTDS
jgi:hypothetical protein